MEDFVCLSSQILYLNWRYTQLGRSYPNAIQRNNALVGVLSGRNVLFCSYVNKSTLLLALIVSPVTWRNSYLLRNWSFALKPAIQCESFQLERPWMIGSSTWISLQMLWRHNVHVRSFCFAKLSSWSCKCHLDPVGHSSPWLSCTQQTSTEGWERVETQSVKAAGKRFLICEWQLISQLKGGEIARKVQDKNVSKCFFLITHPNHLVIV